MYSIIKKVLFTKLGGEGRGGKEIEFSFCVCKIYANCTSRDLHCNNFIKGLGVLFYDGMYTTTVGMKRVVKRH